MENKIDERYQLADTISNLLLSDENAGIQLWKDSVDKLKLQQTDLPVLDVLSCVYNAEEYVAHAIESVLLQSYPNIRLIIVSDGCTDRTTDIVSHYASKYPIITHIINPKNLGIIESANIGLKACTSKFIARMDLDDLIHPMRFEKQMSVLLGKSSIGAISSYMKIFNERHEIRETTYRDNFEIQKITMLFYSPLSHAATIFRAEVIKGIGYRNGYQFAEDYDLWFQIMSQHETAVYPDFLYYYRTHSNQVTNPRNTEIVQGTWVKILGNIFDQLKLNYNSEDIQFHITYCSLLKPVKTLEEWLRFHHWLNQIVKANETSRFFNHQLLKDFLFMNYWMAGFNQFKNEMSVMQFYQIIHCPLNPLSLFGKYKLLAKHLIGK